MKHRYVFLGAAVATVALSQPAAMQAAGAGMSPHRIIVAPDAATYGCTFDNASDMDQFRIIDSNDDGKKWKYVADKQWTSCAYNGSQSMNDWLITPLFELEAGRKYTISFGTKSSGENYPERIEVFLGRDREVASMTIKLIEPTDVATGENAMMTLGAYFTPEESGQYCLGFHGISDPDMNWLAVDDIRVSSPDAVSSLVFSSDFAGSGIQGWTVIDSNNDGEIWETTADGRVNIRYNSSLDMDDWLISPAMDLEAGQTYEVVLVGNSASSTYLERIEVKAGMSPTPEGMTETAIKPTILPLEEETYKGTFVAAQSGAYHIGVHGISDADMNILTVRSVSVSAVKAPGAPAQVTDLTVTPDQSGALKATVSFKTPDKMTDGSAIGSLDKVELSRGETVVKTFPSPAVGEVLTFDDVLTEAGEVTYSVVAYADGNPGLAATESAFVGLAAPSAPGNVTLHRTANPGEVSISWDAVTTDVNGKTVPQGAVTYTVVRHDGNEWVTIKDGLTSTSHTFMAVAQGQEFVQCGVYAVTTQGQTAADAPGGFAVGVPYDKINESFANAEFHYNWSAEHIVYGYIDLFTDSQLHDMKSVDGDNGYMGIYGNDGCGMKFISGLVTTSGMENPALTFFVNNLADGNDPDELEVAVNVIDGTSESGFVTRLSGTIGELCSGKPGWQKLTVPLKEHAGKTVQFSISGLTRNYLYKYFDDIRLESVAETDLAIISLTGPDEVAVGEEYDLTVIVRNDGTKATGTFEVKLFADGEQVGSNSCSETLSPGATWKTTFTSRFPQIATAPVVYTATVSVDGDGNASNDNSDDLTVKPVVPSIPVPVQLAGECDDEGIILTWAAPDLGGAVGLPVSEGFEDSAPFASEVDGWVFADVDDHPLGGLSGITIPGFDNGDVKGSFFVWDNSSIDVDFTFKAHNGQKYIFSLYRADDGQADDWAISPELSGRPQQVSFYAASYNERWLEEVEVYYSEGSTDPADFVKVEGVGGTVPGPTGTTEDTFVQGWTRYAADLPDGAKRFAIRSCGVGAMMLMIDDVMFIPADGFYSGLEIEGYNVYRDGEKINDAVVTSTEYKDRTVTPGTSYRYAVTAIYAGEGESTGSDELEIGYKNSGISQTGVSSPDIDVAGNDIVVTGASGMRVRIVSVDGTVRYDGAGSDRTVVSVGRGVYIVAAGQLVRKVVVR